MKKYISAVLHVVATLAITSGTVVAMQPEATAPIETAKVVVPKQVEPEKKPAVAAPKEEVIAPVVVPKPEPVAPVVPTPPVYTGSHEDMMREAGISSLDFGAVDYILSHESGWRHSVRNGEGSGAYGLCQALPAEKMASAGSDWETNPVTQLRWCSSYAIGRYGSWQGAYAFWSVNHWW